MPDIHEHHLDLLAGAAIDPDVARTAGVVTVTRSKDLPDDLSSWRNRSITPGLLFPVHGPDGRVVHQYRPDNPIELSNGYKVPKYLFPKMPLPGVNVHPNMVDRMAGDGPVLIVEGTKQYLSAVSVAPADITVLGISGCWGWSDNGAPSADLVGLNLEDREVVVIFDADVATKIAVWTAADRLAGVLSDMGAGSVRFVRLNASGNSGLDDYLARVPADRRAGVFTRIIDGAPDTLPRKPAKKSGGDTAPEGVTAEEAAVIEGYAAPDPDADAEKVYFNDDGLMVESLLGEILAGGNFALGHDRAIWTYRDGVYVNDPHDLVRRSQAALGDRWRGMHHRNLCDLLAAHLAGDNRVLGDSPLGRLVNVANGMLDVSTGELEPHDPKHLSYAQLPITWDPNATCPFFDEWLADRCGSQVDDLLESVSLMLTPWVGQRKAVFLFGPSHSGKSTLLRIVEKLTAGYVSALTLHQLSTNRFAAAGLYGMVLNSAGDLSDHHVDDLSVFKMLTGDDPVAAEAKFKDPYTFHNRALFIFSANTPPTVSESSRAYLNRVRPFLFPDSFEGHEDQGIEDKLMLELPGILVRLVAAARSWQARGGYLPGDPLVADSFTQQSDVAALFSAEVVVADPGGFTSGATMFESYKAWADSNGRHTLGRNKFLRRMDSVLGDRVRRDGRTGGLGWADVNVLAESDWIETGPCASFARSLTTSLHEEPEALETPELEPEPHREGEVGLEDAKRAQPDEPDPPDPDPHATASTSTAVSLDEFDLTGQCASADCANASGSFSNYCVACTSDARQPEDTP